MVGVFKFLSLRGLASFACAWFSLIFLLGGVSNVILFFFLPEMTYFNLIMGLASFWLGMGLALLGRNLWNRCDQSEPSSWD